MHRRWWLNPLISALLAALLLGLGELVLRAAGWPDPGLYEGDPGSLWTLRPDLDPREVPFPERGASFSVQTSAAGFRGPLPPPGATAVMGDSTSFGWGVTEDEAWPARLAARTGGPVLNAGVPGYSTHQGLLTIDRVLALQPARVIFAFLVRDADPAPAPDHLRPLRRPPDLRLIAALRLLRRPAGPAPAPAGDAQRVPPERYVANLRQLAAAARAAGATPVVLAFPMLAPPEAHLRALDELATELPVLRPALPADSFFPEDPIHLTPAGHARLAEAVAGALP